MSTLSNRADRPELIAERQHRAKMREAMEKGLKRWFGNNPGESYAAAAKACGCGLGDARRVALEIGYVTTGRGGRRAS